MPPTTQPKAKKKSSGGFSFRKVGKDFLKGAQQAAYGLPTGVKINAKALLALQQGDPRPIARMGKESGKATVASVRHPLRDPFSTFLTALSVASAGGGSVARIGAGAKAFGATGKVGKAVSAAAKKPVYTRSFTGTASAPGRPAKQFHGLPASPNPLVRASRAPLDAMYSVSRKRGAKAQKTRFDKEVAPLRKRGQKLTADIQKLEERRAALQAKGHSVRAKGSMNVLSDVDDDIRTLKADKRANEKNINAVVKDINAERPFGRGRLVQRTERRTGDERKRFAKAGGENPPESLAATGRAPGGEVWQGPMNVLRWRMLLNPRYYLQNAVQSGAALAIQQGPHGIVKSSRTARRLRNEAPDIPERVRSTMGDPGMASGVIESGGPMSKATQRAAHVASAPEARLRELAFYAAARAEGITKAADFKKLFSNTSSPQFHRVASKANEAIVDYSRLGKKERGLMRSGVPIFYPMWKGMTRYGVKFPFEHSIQANMLNQTGQQGFDQQMKDFIGGLPPYQPYLTKMGKTKNGMAPTSNFQNIHQFSPANDILTALAQMFQVGGPPPTGGLAQYLGPAPELGYGVAQGRSLQTGWELKGMDEMSPIEAAARDFAPTVPGVNELGLLHSLGVPGLGWASPRETKAYGKPSVHDQLMMWLWGPAYPRQTKLSELRRGAKQARR